MIVKKGEGSIEVGQVLGSSPSHGITFFINNNLIYLFQQFSVTYLKAAGIGVYSNFLRKIVMYTQYGFIRNGVIFSVLGHCLDVS